MSEVNEYMINLRKLLQQEDNNKNNPTCYYCGRKFPADMNGFSNLAIDHRQSVYNDGKDVMDNYVISCRQCNSQKGKKSFEKNSEEENSFKKERERAKKLDDDYVEKLYAYMKLDSFPDETFLTNLIEELIEELKKDEEFENVRRYGRSGGFSIEWENKANIKWKFNLTIFKLESKFLVGKMQWRDESKHEMLKDRLCSEGYYYEGHLEKYLRPFEDVSDGKEMLKEEMNKIKKICVEFNIMQFC